MVSAIAGMSSNAMIDCEKKSGERHSRTSVMTAALRSDKEIPRPDGKPTSRPASRSTASRRACVTMEYPKRRHAAASYSITPGGWTLGIVECGNDLAGIKQVE